MAFGIMITIKDDVVASSLKETLEAAGLKPGAQYLDAIGVVNGDVDSEQQIAVIAALPVVEAVEIEHVLAVPEVDIIVHLKPADDYAPVIAALQAAGLSTTPNPLRKLGDQLVFVAGQVVNTSAAYELLSVPGVATIEPNLHRGLC